ncbi:hypothetical protein CBM2589_B190110 [Cupriavidus taiwanensis]|uniref:Uncharacterized protein n=1 Tax=Cupriavidus taiwanensis TaxID=164546 RepID=A0A975WXH3_9BURK|nr:hypothetical protein CBM2589_B190110 [Cupriavidus taiwanensis]
MVVQSVRIPACHAGGRGFESRPLRQFEKPAQAGFFFCTEWSEPPARLAAGREGLRLQAQQRPAARRRVPSTPPI